MVIQDNGHDRDSTLATAGKIDSVYLVLPGHDVFRSIQRAGLSIEETDTNNRIEGHTTMVRFNVRGGSGDTDHSWLIRIEKLN